LYQTESCVFPAGTVNVWVKALSPFVEEVLPARAQAAPLWHPAATIEVVPLVVQPVLPDSKPPFVTPGAGGGGGGEFVRTTSS
jgi:hypothetical protein